MNYRYMTTIHNIIEKTQNNILFCVGAGKLGKDLLNVLIQENINTDNIIFIDNNKNLHNTTFLHRDIIFPIKSKAYLLEKITAHDFLIISGSKNNLKEILIDLEEDKGLENINFTSSLVMLKVENIQFDIHINNGYCPICQKESVFIKFNDWLRDHYNCINCFSIPRHRAMIYVLDKFVSNWKNLKIHELGASGSTHLYMTQNCENYTTSGYFDNYESGQQVSYNGKYIQCQDIENMSFENNSIDIIITQDVLEHIFNPEKAFKEIERVLANGGVHVFTVPWYKDQKSTIQRSKINDNGMIEFIYPPDYHGDPYNEKGSLVTYMYGQDLVDNIYKSSGMYTTIYLIENHHQGIEAEFLEVFVSKKI